MSTHRHWRELGKKDQEDQEDQEEEEDKLLATLSPEELRELERELAELDTTADVPVGLRQRDQTARSPTGTFDRGALLRYWEDENRKLLEDVVVEPDCGQAHAGQRQQPDKSRGKHVTGSDGLKHQDGVKKTTFQKRKKGGSVLVKAPQSAKKNQEEKKDLCKTETAPKCLGSCLRKVGYALCKDPSNEPGMNAVSADDLNDTFVRPSGNPIVVADALEKILRNDAGTRDVNLNNVEDISQETLLRFAEALRANTHVHAFSLANTRADDRVAFAISKTLRENGSIKSLNIESNFVSGQGILALLTSLQRNRTLEELRFHNQRHICGGQVEMEMVRLLRENSTLLKLGYQFDLPGPRMTATSILTRNQDQQRQRRLQIQKNEARLPEAPVAGKPSEHVSGSSVENKPVKKLPQSSVTNTNQTKNTHNAPLLPPSTADLPPEKKKTAYLVKEHEGSSSTKGQQSHKKARSSKVKSGVHGNDSADIIQELRSALRPCLQKRGEGSAGLLTSRISTRDDLMEAIRGSSVRSLKRVNLSQN